MIKLLTILFSISQLFDSNESITLKIKPTTDCGTLLNRTTAKSHNPELAYFVMGQLTIHSKKYGDHVVLYDDNDRELISKYHWGLKKDKHNFYARAPLIINQVKICEVTMHRLIMGFPKEEVDHKNGRGLDNRKKNLRKATDEQNARNRKTPKNNTSGYKGVSFKSENKKFQAYISHQGVKLFLGYHLTARKAAIIYNEAAIKYYGEFERLNQL